jgi:hypothetical protein
VDSFHNILRPFAHALRRPINDWTDRKRQLRDRSNRRHHSHRKRNQSQRCLSLSRDLRRDALHPGDSDRLAAVFQSVVINIVDVNNATPAFPQSSRLSLNVSRRLSLGSMFRLPAADDRDSPANGIRLYKTSLEPVTSWQAAVNRLTYTLCRLPDGSIDVTLVLVASLRDGGSAYDFSFINVFYVGGVFLLYLRYIRLV